jgi:hypothetical protein
MSDTNKSDDLPFLDDLPYTPTPEQEPERPPAPDSADRTAPKESAEGKPVAGPAGPAPAGAPKSQAPVAPAPKPAAPTTHRAAPAPPQQAGVRPQQARESDGKRAVIPPAVLAHRMQRYSVYLIVAAFLLMGLNYDALSLSAVLWFAAGLSAGFAILCAVAVVLLNAVAWNFDRLREELRGGRESIDLRE